MEPLYVINKSNQKTKLWNGQHKQSSSNSISYVFIGLAHKCYLFSRIESIISTAYLLSYNFLLSTLHGIKHFWRLCFIQMKVYVWIVQQMFHRTMFFSELNKSGFRTFNITSKINWQPCTWKRRSFFIYFVTMNFIKSASQIS